MAGPPSRGRPSFHSSWRGILARVCSPFLHGPDTGRGDLYCLHPTLPRSAGCVSPDQPARPRARPVTRPYPPRSARGVCPLDQLARPWACPVTRDPTLTHSAGARVPGSASQAQGAPRSPEAAVSHEYRSARYSLGEVRQGAKQTETRPALQTPLQNKETPFSLLSPLPTDRKSAFQLRPVPGWTVAQALGAQIHTDSDPQHLPPTPSPPSRVGSVRAEDGSLLSPGLCITLLAMWGHLDGVLCSAGKGVCPGAA